MSVTLTQPILNRAGPAILCIATALLHMTAAMAQTRVAVLPSGTVIPVRLDREMSSKTARSGDRFTVTVRSGNGDSAMPEGTTIQGVVQEAQRASNGNPGVLDLDFSRMVTSGGQNRSLSGTVIALNGSGVKQSDSGSLVATGNKSKDRLKFIGIGAGSGLLIGALTKKDNFMSTLLGAGAGYLYNEFANKPKAGDVVLKAGTEFGIRLDRQLRFQTNQPLDYARNAVGTTDGDRNFGGRYADDQTSPNADTGNGIGMTIDGRDVSFGSTRPFLRDGFVLLPFDSVARAANVNYDFNASTRTISALNGRLRTSLDSRIAEKNGRRYQMPVASEMREGKLYVPLQFISLATGGAAIWESDSQTAILTTGALD